jgi:hypothetical protein
MGNDFKTIIIYTIYELISLKGFSINNLKNKGFIMKSFFKRILRRVDLELQNFSIEKSENARFFTMLSHHKVNTIFDISANGASLVLFCGILAVKEKKFF